MASVLCAVPCKGTFAGVRALSETTQVRPPKRYENEWAPSYRIHFNSDINSEAAIMYNSASLMKDSNNNSYIDELFLLPPTKLTPLGLNRPGAGPLQPSPEPSPSLLAHSCRRYRGG
ncbi:hypothetical protein BJX76DRAFT_152675 [Aspergillus varians]